MAIEPQPLPTSNRRAPGRSGSPSLRLTRSNFAVCACSSVVVGVVYRAHEYVIDGPRTKR